MVRHILKILQQMLQDRIYKFKKNKINNFWKSYIIAHLNEFRWVNNHTPETKYLLQAGDVPSASIFCIGNPGH